jgi:GTPase
LTRKGEREPEAFTWPGETPEGYRSGFVALVGRPNSGKSTLVNHLLGRKVSIVSDKPQTTRHRITAVMTSDTHQLIVLDIPGFQKPRDLLTSRMQSVVTTTLEEVDAVLFLLPGDQKIGRGDAYIAAYLARTPTPVLVAVNKADLLDPEAAAGQVAAAAALGHFPQPHLISALTGEGIAELRCALEASLPEGPRYFPPDMVSDQPEELLIAELVREKVLKVTQEEIPHSVAVQVLEMEARQGRDLVDVRVAVYVERDSQKPILLGEGGLRLKTIGTEARMDIERLLGSQVYLELVVRVRKHWRRDPRVLGRLGL